MVTLVLKNLIETRGTLTLTDYDLVTAGDESIWNPGTPLYCAPDAKRDDKAHPSQDVFALGAALYHLASDREPFPVGDKTHGVAWLQKEQEAWPLLAQFIDKATSLSKSDRFKTAMDALQWLKHQTTDDAGEVLGEEPTGPDGLGKSSSDNGRNVDVLQPMQVPWLLELLKMYPGSPKGNVETRGLDSRFALSTYVETPLENEIVDLLCERVVRLVVLCGKRGATAKPHFYST